MTPINIILGIARLKGYNSKTWIWPKMSPYCFLVVKPKLILLLETSLFSSFYNTISISGPTLSHIQTLEVVLGSSSLF